MLIKETIHKFRNFLGQPFGPELIIDEKDLVHDLYGKAWFPLSHKDSNFVQFVRTLHTHFKCAGDPEHKVPPLSYFTQKVEQVECMLMNAKQMKTVYGPAQVQLYIQRPLRTSIVVLEVMQKNPYADVHVLFDNEHLSLIHI